MTGSALSKYLQVRAARNVSCGEKEMILRRIGGGLEGEWWPAAPDGRLADDGKRLSDAYRARDVV